MPFTLTYKLTPKVLPWTFSRPQWNALTRFASVLERPTDMASPHVTTPDVLQFYLAYLIHMRGRRFQTDLPDSGGGGRIAVQLNAFLQGWRAFTRLTGFIEILLAKVKGRSVGATRALKSGPQSPPYFPKLSQAILLPCWHKVESLIAAGMRRLQMCGDNETRDTEIWRKREPGITESQCAPSLRQQSFSLASHPERAFRRLHAKTSLMPWQQQQLAFMQWRKTWPSLPEMGQKPTILKGQSILDWVLAQGVLDVHDILALVSRWARTRRLALSLVDHNLDHGHRAHVFASVCLPRWTCSRCGCVGPHMLRKPWMLSPCPGPFPGTIEAFCLALRNEAQAALAIQAAITALYRRC